MRVFEQRITRRAALQGALAGALVWAGRSLVRPVLGQELVPFILAVPVAQVPTDPQDPAWGQAAAWRVPMKPQDLVVPRVTEAGAQELFIRAVHDPQRLGFLIEWRDAHQDSDLGTVLQYRDALALQFPEDPSRPTPSFTMGQRGNGVVIYHWKSDWQFGRLHDVDEAYPNMYGDWYPFSGVEAGVLPEATDYLTRGRKEYLTAAAAGNALADPEVQEKVGAVQKMRAEGFGTLEPHPDQDGTGQGQWAEGAWRTVLSVPRQQAKFFFEERVSVPVAFAAWDGSRNERNGQKAYSTWSTLRLQAVAEARPGSLPWMVPFFSSIFGGLLLVLTGLLGREIWRTRKRRG